MNDFAALQAPNKAPTEIEGFKHIAMGGLTEGRTALVAGSSGLGKTLMCTRPEHHPRHPNQFRSLRNRADQADV